MCCRSKGLRFDDYTDVEAGGGRVDSTAIATERRGGKVGLGIVEDYCGVVCKVQMC